MQITLNAKYAHNEEKEADQLDTVPKWRGLKLILILNTNTKKSAMLEMNPLIWHEIQV